MITQWIFIVFHHGHSQLHIKLITLVPLKYTGPKYQRNGASLVFMHCVALEIHLFSWLQETKFQKYMNQEEIVKIWLLTH